MIRISGTGLELGSGNRYCGEISAGDGVCLIADRTGVEPGGGGLCICLGEPFVVGEKRADFLEDALRLLVAELPEPVRLWPTRGA